MIPDRYYIKFKGDLLLIRKPLSKWERFRIWLAGMQFVKETPEELKRCSDKRIEWQKKHGIF